VLEKLEIAVAARPELWSTTSVTATACLGPCFDGPNVVVYPESCWYAHVTIGDIDELVAEHLENGRAVERLRAVEED
jgi:(2Fe-2S) ferredoxin